MQLPHALRSLVLGSTLVFSTALAAEAVDEPPYLVLQTAPQESVTSVAVSPDGSLVATSSFDGRVRIHDARTGVLLHAFGSDADRGGREVVFLSDGRSLAVAGFRMDKLVRLWDAQTGKVLQTLAGHQEIETYAIAISPDGKLLASSGTDKQILVWELASGTLRHHMDAQPHPVMALAFSRDSATLASGGGDRVIRLWEMGSGEQRRSLEGHRDWISHIAFSPDGAQIASASCDWGYHRGRDTTRFDPPAPQVKSEWMLWSAETGKVQRTVSEPGRILSLAFSPDGRSLACGVGNDVRLYDLHNENSTRVVTSHESAVTAVAFTRDGGSIISGSHDRTAKRVDAATGKVQWHLPGYWEQVNSVALSRDGSLIATGSSDLRFAEGLLKADARQLGPGGVRLWDAHTGRLLRRLGEPPEQVLAVAISPDGRRVASGGATRDGSSAVRLWNAATGDLIWTRQDHTDTVLTLAFTADGSSLASGGAEGAVKLRDTKTGAVVQTFERHDAGVTSVAIAPDGTVIGCGAGDGSIKLWNVRRGHVIRTFEPAEPTKKAPTGRDRLITSVAFSPDGHMLASCQTNTASWFGKPAVRVWDLKSGELKQKLSSPQNRGRFVAFAPDSRTLATSGEGKSIVIWDIENGKIIHKLEGHPHPPQSVAYSTDGRILVSGSDYRQTKVWEVATERLLATLVTFSESKPGTGADDWLAHTPEGFYVGSPGIDRYLAWRVGDDMKTPAELGEQLHRPERVEAALSLEQQ